MASSPGLSLPPRFAGEGKVGAGTVCLIIGMAGTSPAMTKRGCHEFCLCCGKGHLGADLPAHSCGTTSSS